MATPKTVLWTRDTHTAAKHQILYGYLRAYFPIMSKQYKDRGVCFVDAFAGPGEYRDHSDGSPIRAIDAARNYQVFESATRLAFLFVEKDKRRLQHLDELLKLKGVPTVFEVELVEGDCTEVLVPALYELALWDRPMFVNLDGWGVDVPYELVSRIGTSERPEVLVTFGSQWFTRFAEEQTLQAGDVVYGDTSWRAVVGVPTEEKKGFLVGRYRERLAACGFTFQLTFELVDERGHPLFLVFGTQSEYGVRKMKDAMWMVDPSQGSKFRDPRDPAQLVFDLSDRAPDLRVLQTQLLERLKLGPAPIAELQHFALLETIYKEAHASAALHMLEQESLVTIGKGRTNEHRIVRRAEATLFGRLS